MNLTEGYQGKGLFSPAGRPFPTNPCGNGFFSTLAPHPETMGNLSTSSSSLRFEEISFLYPSFFIQSSEEGDGLLYVLRYGRRKLQGFPRNRMNKPE